MMDTARKALRVTDRLVKYLEVLMAALAGLLVLGMMFVIVITIVARSMSLFPTAWIIEVSEYMLLILTFLVAPWVMRHDAHIRFDLVVTMVNTPVKRVLYYLGNIVGLLVMLTIVYFGYKITSNFVDRNLMMINYLRLPKAPFMAVIPLGSALLAYEFLRNLVTGYREESNTPLEGV